MGKKLKDKKIQTYAEYRRALLARYEENPDDPDPEIQQFKKEMEEFNKKLAPTLEGLAELTKTSRAEAASALVPNFMPDILALNNSTKQYMESALSAYEMIEPLIRPIQEGSIFSQSLINSMKGIAESVQQMAKPAQAMLEMAAIYHAPILYFKIPELHHHVILSQYDPTAIQVPFKVNAELELTREVKHLKLEIKRLRSEGKKPDKGYLYSPDSDVIIFSMQKIVAISFATERGNSNIGTFIKICMELLERSGTTNGDYNRSYAGGIN